MASDLLTVLRSEIEVRLVELRPLMSEFERLTAAAEALGVERDGAASARAGAKASAGLAKRSAKREGRSTQEAPSVSRGETPAPAPAAAAIATAEKEPPRAPGRRRTGTRAKRGSAAGAIERASSSADARSDTTSPSAPPASAPTKVRKREPSVRSAVGQAIVAALEHGSHTPGELIVVTAMSGPDIQGGLRRLKRDGTIVKTERDGKTAYALPSADGS
jgi:hypothetical protein